MPSDTSPEERLIFPSIATFESKAERKDQSEFNSSGDNKGQLPEKTSKDKKWFEAMRGGESDKARKLFPERGGDVVKSSWFDTIFKGKGTEAMDKIRCERNVYKSIQDSPLVKLMFSALKASGCPVDIRRHISCEVCDESVTGGFDPYLNQVVVCQNTATNRDLIEGTMTHELIHMFDYCRHKMDLTNLQHLACTEIRAANLIHCSFLSAFIQGTASMFTIKQFHQNCVKYRALESVKAVKDVTREQAWEAVREVFDMCYNDLEPFGRRLRRNSPHIRRVYEDRISVGYE